jgi:AraC-like DNA-binding protein
MPLTYLRIVLRHFAAADVPTGAVLGGTGLEPRDLASGDRLISVTQMRRLLANLSVLSPAPGWHLSLAAHLSITSHGPVGVAAATAPNLGESLRVLLRYVELRAPFLWWSGQLRGDRYEIRIVEAEDLGAERILLIEIAMIAFQSIVVALTGRPMRGARLELAYPAPACRDALAAAFHGELHYDCGSHLLSLPSAWLDEPCALHDEVLHRTAVARCRQLMQQITGESDTEVLVRHALLAARGEFPALAEIAAELNVSPRTLIRRLRVAGTSYRGILQDVQRTLAVDYLSHSELSVAEVGYRLGFADAANFNRAFRAWFGTAPGRFRRMRRSVR